MSLAVWQQGKHLFDRPRRPAAVVMTNVDWLWTHNSKLGLQRGHIRNVFVHVALSHV